MKPVQAQQITRYVSQDETPRRGPRHLRAARAVRQGAPGERRPLRRVPGGRQGEAGGGLGGRVGQRQVRLHAAHDAVQGETGGRNGSLILRHCSGHNF